MNESMTIQRGPAYPFGVYRKDNTLLFSAAFGQGLDCGLCLFTSKTALLILFDETFRTGRIYSAILEHYSQKYDSYLLYEDGVFFPDPYARHIFHSKTSVGTKPCLNEIIVQYAGVSEQTHNVTDATDIEQADSTGLMNEPGYTRRVVCSLKAPVSENELFLNSLSKETRRCAIMNEQDNQYPYFSNGHSTPNRLSSSCLRPMTPYAHSFFYCLNVRGFTMQDRGITPKSERGTFKALEQKIPYLLSLGVTAVELMPIFEMDPLDQQSNTANSLFMKDGFVHTDEQDDNKSYLWGFREGFYFAIHHELAANQKDPVQEFKHMVEAFHAAGLEVILQFWFADSCSKNLIIECIRYYVTAFSIDGIHIKSDNIPTDMLLTDPLFFDIKILGRNILDVLNDRHSGETTRFPALYTEEFMWRARHFLKSDDLSLVPFIENAFSSTSHIGDIRYICNYDGFTLRDLVTYEHKHNEANGENSEDGRNDNVSWNCGYEGETRKKQVLNLRHKQMLNAISFVFLSVGTPLINAGDECGNTQSGNNNPYCQDNPLGWTDLDSRGKYTFLTDYIRFLMKIRKQCYDSKCHCCGTLHSDKSVLPNLSFHGVEAWKPDYGNNSHAIGVMYSLPNERHLFAALNMYWNDARFDLPAPPTGFKWFVLSDTALTVPVHEKAIATCDNAVHVQARSVVILQALPDADTIQKQPPLKTNAKRFCKTSKQV